MANSLEQFILPDPSRNSEMIGWQIIDRPHISSRVRVGKVVQQDVRS